MSLKLTNIWVREYNKKSGCTDPLYFIKIDEVNYGIIIEQENMWRNLKGLTSGIPDISYAIDRPLKRHEIIKLILQEKIKL